MGSRNSIATRLKALREERGLTVAELAEASGVSQPYIWQIESSRRKNPGGETIQKLSTGLGVSIEELLSGPRDPDSLEDSDLPKSLKEFVKKRGKELSIRQSDIDMLRHINYRGRLPKSDRDWELIFVFLQRMLDR